MTAPERTVGPDGGGVSVTVGAARECQWTASSDASWATPSVTSGQGEGTISVSIAATQQPSVRTAEIKVNDQRLVLSQEGRPCTFTLSSSRVEIGAQGGTVPVSVETHDACSWNASSSIPWINAPAGRQTGARTITLSIAANLALTRREAEIAIADHGFVVVQRGTASPPDSPDPPAPGPPLPGCAPVIQPAAFDVGIEEDAVSVAITVGSTCAWSASSEAPWIAVHPASGMGSAQVTLFIDANGGGARTGTAIVAGRPVAVRQAGASAPPPQACTYTLDPPSQTADDGAGEGRFRVITGAGCAWTAQSDSAWAFVLTPRGEGSGEVRFTIDRNLGRTDRTATITVAGQVHTLTQRYDSRRSLVSSSAPPGTDEHVIRSPVPIR